MGDTNKLSPSEYEVSTARIREFEIQEAASWADYFLRIPDDLATRLGLNIISIKNAVATAASQIDILAFNRVIGLGLAQEVSEADLADLIRFYRENGSQRFFVQVSPAAQPQTLPALLKRQGLEYYNNWAKLYRPVEKLPLMETPLALEQIGPDYADIFSSIIVRAFDWPKALKPLITLPVGRPGWLHYLAYRDHFPVACAALFIRDEIASLAFAATLPEARGLGSQSALIRRRINDAAEAGCRWIISETAEEKPEKPVTSYRNMLKGGFRVAYLRPNYIFVNEAE